MTEAWMQTASGVAFRLLDPRPEDVHPGDIAAALAKICRLNGACFRFLSVGEHSVHCAEAAPDDLRLTALLHDGTEAYLGDVIRPLKNMLPDYRKIEDRLGQVLAERFGTVWPLPAEVKRIDDAALAAEVAQAMAPPPM